MRRNQIGYIVILAAVIVLASFHGGSVSYILLYTWLALPVVALGYTFYVYRCLEFYQNTSEKIIEKGKKVPYEIHFKNETLIPFTYIAVTFHERQCEVEEGEQFQEYCLLPGSERRVQTTIKCYYRGSYTVGVKAIEVMDFLYLFKITYSVMWPLELTVLPKVIPLNQLGILPAYEDPKKSAQYTKSEQMLLENEMRKYQPGDHLKQVHWKASAKMGQLLSRK